MIERRRGGERVKIKRRKSVQSDEYFAIGARLRALRKRAGLTQRALALRLRESQTWVSNVENGHRRADGYEITCWMRACGFHDANLVLHAKA